MRGYASFLAARMRVLLQYRAAALAGFGTQLFWGLIRVMIFEAFYRSSTAAQPMTMDEVRSYIWLGQAMLILVMWGPDTDLRDMIRTGGVAYELLRPLDVYWVWFTRCLAQRTIPLLFRAVPMFLVAGLFLGLQAPPSPGSAVAWLGATLAAILMSAAFATLISLSLLWTISGEGMCRILPVVCWVLSGLIVPLPLYPDWAQHVIMALPFRGLADTPFRLYIGHIPASESVPAIAHQLVWTSAMVVIGRLMLARGLRRVVVQGG